MADAGEVSGKKRALFFAFVDVEKAFDRVPREVVRWVEEV